MSVSKKLIISIAAAFAFTVLSTDDPVKPLSFLPSQAVSFDETECKEVCGLSVIDAECEVELKLRIVELIKEHIG